MDDILSDLFSSVDNFQSFTCLKTIKVTKTCHILSFRENDEICYLSDKVSLKVDSNSNIITIKSLHKLKLFLEFFTILDYCCNIIRTLESNWVTIQIDIPEGFVIDSLTHYNIFLYNRKYISRNFFYRPLWIEL